MPGDSDYASVRSKLVESGLLLTQDKRLASVVTLMTGEPLSASWWGHSRGKDIFRCLGRLADDPDVLVTKLVSRKVTYVHRRLWPAVLTVAQLRETWQLARLSPESRKLLKEVESRGELIASGKAAADLEVRLLVHGEQVHTDTGVHKYRLETWGTWSERVDLWSDLSVDDAREELQNAVRAIGGTGTELPWNTSRPKRR